MAYTVLARRYRSQSFDDVVGQDAIAQTLKNAINTDRVAHAYLFCGTRGVGKTTMARILAKALNCLSSDKPTIKPCCKCDSCVSINTGDDIDVIEIDGASNTGVDNIRELRQNAIYRPTRARFKIYIIDEVHMLSTGAFNALLKILEEPPAHVKFIFATTEPDKVLATIQSRCQRFDFVNISAADIAKQLKFVLEKEDITFQDDLIVSLSRIANGSMRDALSLLDQLISSAQEPLTVESLEKFIGQPGRDKLIKLTENIIDSNAVDVLKATAELLDTGHSGLQVVDGLMNIFRDLMVIIAAGTELTILTEAENKTFSKLAEKMDIASAIYNISALEKLRYTVKTSDNPGAILEATLLRLTLSEQFIGTKELIDSLSKISASGGFAGGSTKKKIKVNLPQSAGNKSSQVVKKVIDTVDAETMAQNWQKILEACQDDLGNNKVSLEKCKVASYKNNLLILQYPGNIQFQIDLMKRPVNAKKITNAFSQATGQEIMLSYKPCDEITELEEVQKKPKGAKLSEAERKQMIDDKAVKAVVEQLNATIIAVERK